MNSLFIIFYLGKLDNFVGYIIKIYDFNFEEKKANTLDAVYSINGFEQGKVIFSK